MLYEVKRAAAVIGRTLAAEYAAEEAAAEAPVDVPAQATEPAVAAPATPTPSSYVGAAVEAQNTAWYPEALDPAEALPAQPGFPTPPTYVPYGTVAPEGNGHPQSWS
jgi:hypothetical protein